MLEDTVCDTELCLTPGGRHYCPASHSDSADSSRNYIPDCQRMEVQEGRASHQQQQQVTIFYGGRVCVCDATEIRARAIIRMAQREMEEMATKKQNDRGMESYPLSPATRTPPAMPQLLNPGLSMKRSLKQFLQKRKSRADDSSPYKSAHHHLPSS